MNIPHFNRTLTSLVSGSIIFFSLIVSNVNSSQNLFRYFKLNLLEYSESEKKLLISHYGKFTYFVTPSEVEVENQSVNIVNGDPLGKVKFDILNIYPGSFLKIISLLFFLAVVYIIGEILTTMADLTLWLLFRFCIFNKLKAFFICFLICLLILLCLFSIQIKLICLLLIVLIFIILANLYLYQPFINFISDMNKGDVRNTAKDNYLVECPFKEKICLEVGDWISVDKEESFLMRESERYFDYSLFFASVSFSFLFSWIVFLRNLEFISPKIFLLILLICFCLAIFNRLRANIFFKLASISKSSSSYYLYTYYPRTVKRYFFRK